MDRDRLITNVPGTIAILVLAVGLTAATSWTELSLSQRLGGFRVYRKPTASQTAPPVIQPQKLVPVIVHKATVTSPVNLRSGKSTTSAIISDVKGGDEVVLGSDQDALWQEVEYHGLKGYIARTYLNYQ